MFRIIIKLFHVFLNCYTDCIFTETFFIKKKSLAMPRGMWDLSSLTRDQTSAPCSGSMDSLPVDHQGSTFLKKF